MGYGVHKDTPVNGVHKVTPVNGVHKVTPVNGTKWKKYFVTLQKGKWKARSNTGAQLHHFSKLLRPWLKVNVKQLNELWCPESDPRSWYNVETY